MKIKDLIKETKIRININMTLFKFCEEPYKKALYSTRAKQEIENYVKLKQAIVNFGEDYEIETKQ